MPNIKPISDEKTEATLRLINELVKGRISGEQEGWLEPEDMRVPGEETAE